MSMSSDPILTEQQIEQLKNQQGGIEFGLGRRGSIDLNPAASAILGTITVDPIATLRDRILRQQGIIEEQTRGTNIDPAQYLKELEDALAAAGLDQQGNPIQPEDPSINPLAVNPLLAQDAVNTGPFVTNPAIADVDDKETGVSSETAEQILAKYKDRADPVTDMLGDYKQEDGSIFPVNVLVEIISDYAVNKDNKDAQVILGKWNDKVADTASTPVGGTPQGQTGTPQGKTNTPQGSKPTPQGVTPQGGTPTSDTPAVDSPIGTSTVSTGSVLDQTGTGDVKVDDQPAGLLNIPTPMPQQPERKAGMIMQISQSAPIVETVFPDILFEPKFTKLDNIPDFNLPSGLLRTLV